MSVLRLCEIIILVSVQTLKPANGPWQINGHVFNPALIFSVVVYESNGLHG